MSSSRRRRRFGWSITASALLCLIEPPRTASAQTRQECAASASDAQDHMKERALAKARGDLLICASPACPELIRTDCEAWLNDVARDMPTVVFGATDAFGADLISVTVLANGKTVQTQLDGAPVPVDPGLTTFRFEKAGFRVAEERLMILSGEKSRTLRVVMLRERPSGPWFFLGGAGAALTAFGVLQGLAQAEYAELESTCGRTQSCSASTVAPTEGKFLASGVMLGLGCAGLIGASTWWLVDWATAPVADSAVKVAPYWDPTTAAAGVTVTGTF